MKTILIVDDDEVFRETLVDTVRKEVPELDIRTAENGKTALDLLNRMPVDMLVTDLNMPVMDGFELLAAIKDQNKKVPVMVVTEFPLEEVQDVLGAMGFYMFYRKTTNPITLINRIKDTTRAEVVGSLHGLTTAGVLQLLEAERKNCLITVEAVGKSGQIYMKDGGVIDAHTPDMHGIDAAMKIVCWNNVKITLSHSFGYERRVITMKLTDLLLNAFVSQDEAESEAWEIK